VKIRIDVITGFLGSGKTTWIKKLIESKVFEEETLVIIENEFGEVPIDQILLDSSEYTLIELSKGCLCCSLKGDLITTLDTIRTTIKPTRILIEPSGIFILEDLFEVLKSSMLVDYYQLNHIFTIVDSKLLALNKLRYTQFFSSQIKFATQLILSKLDIYGEDCIDEAIHDLRTMNSNAVIHALLPSLWTKEILSDLFKQENYYTMTSSTVRLADTNHKSIESFGIENVRQFSRTAFETFIVDIQSEQYGYILRIKGFILVDGVFFLLNYNQGEYQLEKSTLSEESKLAIIGEKLQRDELRKRLTKIYVNVKRVSG